MIRHLRYDEQRYDTPDACVREIARRVDSGWQIAELTPLGRGRFRVLYRVASPRGDERNPDEDAPHRG